MDYFYRCITFTILLAFLFSISKLPYSRNRTQQIVWEIALFRVLIPFRLPSLISVYNWINPRLHLSEVPIVHAHYFYGNTITDILPTSLPETIGLLTIFMRLGLIIFTVGCLLMLISCFFIIRECRPTLNNDAVEWSESISGKCRKVNVLVSDKLTVPMSCNLGVVAFIVVPESLGFTKDTIGIYEHEYYHIKHGDTMWKLLSFLALCLHWFNPLVWIFYRRFNCQMEIACDEAVLAKHGVSYRAEYANILLGFIPCKTNTQSYLFSTFTPNNLLKERVRSIMYFKAQSKKVLVISFTVILILTLCLVTNSFASIGSRKPIIPEPYASSSVEKEIKNTNMNPTIESTQFMLSLKSGTIGEHDIRPNERVIYDNDGGYWSFESGQEISIYLEIVDRHFQTGQMTVIGFVCEDALTEVFSQQIVAGAKVDLTIPKDGDYLFYIDGRSSDTIMVNSFTIE